MTAEPRSRRIAAATEKDATAETARAIQAGKGAIVDDATVERACEAMAAADGVIWADERYQQSHNIEAGRLRTRVRIALEAALAGSQGKGVGECRHWLLDGGFICQHCGKDARTKATTPDPAAPDGDAQVLRDWRRGEQVQTETFTAAIDRAIAALSNPRVGEATFQARVAPWMQECFGPKIAGDLVERGDRFLEESLEKLQSHGYDPSRIPTLVEYVFNRPAGEPSQETGGVMVTLAAYDLAAGINTHDAAETELARIWTKVDVIRQKQASKNRLHTYGATK